MIQKLHQQPLRRTKVLSTLGAVALATLLLPAQASAQSKVVLFPIAPIGENVDESLLNDITNSLFGEIDMRKSFKMDEGKEVVSVAGNTTSESVASAAPVLGSPENYLQAINLLSQGEAATQRNRWEQARTALEDAVRLFENNLTFIEDISKLEEAYFTLAVTYIRLGKENESSANLKKVLSLHPDMVLDAGKYPTYFRSIFETERKDLQAQGKGAINVQSAATGAKIFLDGKDIGTIPTTISNVVAGQHVLRVVAGSEVWAGLVQVKGKATTTQNVPLSAAAAPVQVAAVPQASGPFILPAINSNNFTPEAQKAAIDSAKAMDARFALVGGVAAKDDHLLMPIFICEVETQKCDRLMQSKLDMDLNALDQEAPRFADTLAKKARSISGDVQGAVPFVTNEEETAAVAVVPVVAPVTEPEQETVAEPAPVEVPVAPETTETADAASEDGAPEAENIAVAVVPETEPDIMQSGPIDLDAQAAKKAGKKPVYKQAWFWTVTGVVVVGAATGITLGVLAHQGKFDDKTTFRMVW